MGILIPFERIQKIRAGRPEGGTEVTIIKCDRCGAEVKNKDDYVVSISGSRVERVLFRWDFCANCSASLIDWIREHPKEAPASDPEEDE